MASRAAPHSEGSYSLRIHSFQLSKKVLESEFIFAESTGTWTATLRPLKTNMGHVPTLVARETASCRFRFSLKACKALVTLKSKFTFDYRFGHL